MCGVLVHACEVAHGKRNDRRVARLAEYFLGALGAPVIFQGIVKKFAAVRELSGNPITVTYWDKKSEQDRF